MEQVGIAVYFHAQKHLKFSQEPSTVISLANIQTSYLWGSTTEAANRIAEAIDLDESTPSKFVADYESVWRESVDECICSNLKI